MLTTLLALGALSTRAVASSAPMCSIGELRTSPGYRWQVERVADVVDSASQILRATAIGADSMAQTVTFRPVEWIRRARTTPARIRLPGVAVSHDDFNDGPVPYQIVRRAGRRGDCFASEYRIGAQYLLLLRAGPGSSIRWWPLAPVNEQLRGADDPWLAWVRERARKRSVGRLPVSRGRQQV